MSGCWAEGSNLSVWFLQRESWLMRSVERLKRRFYNPDKGWRDGTQLYMDLVRKYVHGRGRVLDIGAGSGRGFSHGLKGSVGEVVGLDPDEGIMANVELDRAVVGIVEDIPFADGGFDAAVSSFALEHIDNAGAAAREIYRILKPGGVFVFRTPNLWHYATLAARITPQWFHNGVANWARGLDRTAPEPYHTRYRCNTVRRIKSRFGNAGFSVACLKRIEPEPAYLQFSAAAFLLGVAYERLVNHVGLLSAFRVTILGVLQK